jgi:predicted transcriptional regulator
MQYKNTKNFSKSQVFEEQGLPLLNESNEPQESFKNKKPRRSGSGRSRNNFKNKKRKKTHMHYKDNKNSTQSQVQEDQELTFQNKSNDWKYFTIIPNWILDNLPIYDAMLYIHIKRIAGENGQCWASMRYLAQKMKVSLGQIYKSLQNLTELGLIKFVGTKKVKRRPRNVYQIVDIWKLNVDYYNDIHKTNEKSEKNIENQSKVIHNPDETICSYSEQIQEICSYSEQIPDQRSYSEQIQPQKSQKRTKNQSVKKKNASPKKNHNIEEKPNIIINIHKENDDDDDVDNLNPKQTENEQINKKEVITKGEGLFSNTNIQPLIDKFGLDRTLYAMDLINKKYKDKELTYPFKLLQKILEDKNLIHPTYYRQIRNKQPGEIVDIFISCVSCDHKNILKLVVGRTYHLPCSKCGTFNEIDLNVKF